MSARNVLAAKLGHVVSFLMVKEKRDDLGCQFCVANTIQMIETMLLGEGGHDNIENDGEDV